MPPDFIYTLMETELALPNQERDFAVRMDSIIENVNPYAAAVKKGKLHTWNLWKGIEFANIILFLNNTEVRSCWEYCVPDLWDLMCSVWKTR